MIQINPVHLRFIYSAHFNIIPARTTRSPQIPFHQLLFKRMNSSSGSCREFTESFTSVTFSSCCCHSVPFNSSFLQLLLPLRCIQFVLPSVIVAIPFHSIRPSFSYCCHSVPFNSSFLQLLLPLRSIQFVLPSVTVATPFHSIRLLFSYCCHSVPFNSSFLQYHLSPFFPGLSKSSFGPLPLLSSLPGHFVVSLIPNSYNLSKPSSSSSSSSSVICQTTGPKPLPKRFLHVVRSRASSFN